MQIEAQGAIESRFGSTGSENKQTNAPPLGGQSLNVLKLSEGIKNLSCRNLIIYFTTDEENAPQKIEAKGDARLEILLRSAHNYCGAIRNGAKSIPTANKEVCGKRESKD
jgi:hypothetical protein